MTEVAKIVPRHTADREPMVVVEMYLTTDHQLLLMGFCSKCRSTVSFTIPLADLEKNCPTNSDFTIKDIADLHNQFGISLPPEPPLLSPASSS
jgi:hypothetical protein